CPRIAERREPLRDVRQLEIHRCPAVGVRGLGACRARHLQQRREDLPVRVGVLRLLHRLGHPGASRLESGGFRNYGYLSLIVGLAGTTIAPWMQFYLQASIVEKGVTTRQYKASRLDVIIGCLFAAVVAWFIVVACAATLHSAGKFNIETGSQAAEALRPLAGEYAYLLVAAGLFNPPLFAACILPISTAYAVCEGLGLE